MKELSMSIGSSIREIVVRADLDALNTAVTENQIQPEKIISVLFEPRHHMAIGDYEAKYRVIYRL
jgi:hypothetical protein